ncbi:MAG: hypothetical protein JSS14_04160 [Proteobacteria bacterium]|nr:hypothetical protein [Pseudomonadota bacterium]
MSTLTPSSVSTVSGGLSGALKAFIGEASALMEALLSPGKILGEVEQMRALLVAANAAQATDPARAAALRTRASRIGLN